MMNFDIHDLILVNPCELTDECYARAMHAQSILDAVKIVPTFKDAVAHVDFLVATSAVQSKSDKRHLRNPVSIKDFSQKVAEVDGNIGLVFGREDYGLFNEEIAQCDIMVRIPTSDSYLSLNLSHAVCLLLFMLFISKEDHQKKKRHIGDIERETLFDYFAKILTTINYPNHKVENTKVMFRRIMGRAMLSTWEYHTLMGVLSRTLNKINKPRKKK
jgi:tRNA/rRNA methyltransferase